MNNPRAYTNDYMWDDLRFPATGINPPGQASDPDYDTANLGWLFDKSSTETLGMIGQLPHTYNEETSIRPHIHWQQEASGVVLWRLEYKWFNNGAIIPGSFTSLDSNADVFTYTSGNLAQITKFPEIDGTGMNISSNLIMKVSRIGADGSDTYDQDALFYEFDIHMQQEGIGSVQEYIK